MKSILKHGLSQQRYRHCVNVSEEAVRLAEIYGADTEKAQFAGLMHDVTKEMSPKAQLELIEKAGIGTGEEKQLPHGLLHAISASAYLRLKLDVEDEEILAAVRYHTTARAGMTLLEKIIYLADYTSAERDYSDVDVMRRLVDISLEQAMLYALRYGITKNAGKGHYIQIDSINAYNELVLSGVKL